MDFTLNTYKSLLQALIAKGYSFFTFEQFCDGKTAGKFVILRHDIDKKPENALVISKLEFELGIKSSFYFKISNDVFKPEIIKQIATMGHEIGYHYRDLVDMNGDYMLAINEFKKNIETFRNIVPVKTIVMDGCPLSKYDNRNLWKKVNYKDFDIKGEPYFDINFNEIFYMTDTGRRWDGLKYNIRDKVVSNLKFSYHSTSQINDALENSKFPNKVMLTTHPQRWTNNLIYWSIELISQNLKNMIKLIFNRK